MSTNPVDSVIVKFEIDATGLAAKLSRINKQIRDHFSTHGVKLHFSANKSSLASTLKEVKDYFAVRPIPLKFAASSMSSLNKAVRTSVAQTSGAVGVGAGAALTQMVPALSAAAIATGSPAAGFNAAATGIQRMGVAARGARTDFELLASGIFTVRNVLAAVSTLGIIRVFRDMSRAASSFETGMIGVAKTTGMSKAALAELGQELRILSRDLPVATTRLLEIAQTAGQVGVRGAANIAKFAKTIGQLELSTDVVGAEGAASIARVLNILNEGVDTVDSFGSALVALGNDAVSTESEILEVATKLAQATGYFGFSSSQVLGLATAMKDLGINAEIGSTQAGIALKSINDALFEGGDALDFLVTLMGQSKEQMQRLFQEDTFKFLEEFIIKLGQLDKTQAPMALKRIGLEGARMSQVFGPLASRVDLVTKFTKLASKSQRENTALVDEASKAAQSFTAKMQLMHNRFAEVGAILGTHVNKTLGEFVDLVSGGFVNNLQSVTTALEGMGAALSVIGASTALIMLQRTAKSAAAGSIAARLLTVSFTGLVSLTGALVVAVGSVVGVLVAFRNHLLSVDGRVITLADTFRVLVSVIKTELVSAFHILSGEIEKAFGKSVQQLIVDFVELFTHSSVLMVALLQTFWETAADMAKYVSGSFSVVSNSISVVLQGLTALGKTFKGILSGDMSDAKYAITEFELALGGVNKAVSDTNDSLNRIDFAKRVEENMTTLMTKIASLRMQAKEPFDFMEPELFDLDPSQIKKYLDLMNEAKPEPLGKIAEMFIDIEMNTAKAVARLAALRGELGEVSPEIAETAAALGILSKSGDIADPAAWSRLVEAMNSLDAVKDAGEDIESFHKIVKSLDEDIAETAFKSELVARGLSGIGAAAIDAATGLGLTADMFSRLDSQAMSILISQLQAVQAEFDKIAAKKNTEEVLQAFADDAVRLNTVLANLVGTTGNWATAIGVSVQELRALEAITGKLSPGVLELLARLQLSGPQLLIFSDNIKRLNDAAKKEDASQFAYSVGQAFGGMADEMTDAFFQAGNLLEGFKQAFKRFAQDIIKELIHIYLVKRMVGVVTDVVGAVLGVGGGGGQGPLEDIFGNDVSGGLGPRGGASGMTAGATAGPSPKEMASAVSHSAKGSGDVSIYMDLRGSNGDVSIEEAVNKGIRRAAPQLVNASVKKILGDKRRDPLMFKR